MRPINESVLFTVRREFGYLNEMFIEGKRSLKDGSFILAYRSKIWVFPDEQSMEQASKRMVSSIRKETVVKKFRGNRSDFEERPDVLMAAFRIEGDRKELHLSRGLNYNPRPEHSVLVKKVAQALGVTHVFQDSESGNDDVPVQTGNLAKEQTPTWGYHGTSSKYLMGILKNGISPKPQQSNFDTVLHDKTVFLTTDPSKAVFHSTKAIQEEAPNKSARGYGEFRLRTDDAGNLKYQRVILRLKVPDASLIVSDYDIDREGDQVTYTDMHTSKQSRAVHGTIPGDARKVSMSLGVFGYRGRILPQHIESVFVDRKVDSKDVYGEASLSDMSEFKPAFVRKWIDELNEITDGDFGMIDLKDYLDNPEAFIEEKKQARGDSDGE